MTNTETESFASVHRKAVREIERQQLARELAKIYDATHVAVYHGTIYAYGTRAHAEAFADGLRGVTVRPITDKEQHEQAKHKRRVFGNP